MGERKLFGLGSLADIISPLQDWFTEQDLRQRRGLGYQLDPSMLIRAQDKEHARLLRLQEESLGITTLAQNDQQNQPLFVSSPVETAAQTAKRLIAGGVPRLFSNTPVPETFGKAIAERASNLKPLTSEQLINSAMGIGLTAPIAEESRIFKEFKDLTTKFLDYAKGKTYLSRQEISDFARRPELKKGEADLLLNKLKEIETEGIYVPIKNVGTEHNYSGKKMSEEEMTGLGFKKGLVSKIVKSINEGKDIKPIDVVYENGKYNILNGEHRYQAHIEAGQKTIKIVPDSNKIPAQEFADSIHRDLLPLKSVEVKNPQYGSIVVDRTEEGVKGRNYEEVVFESPVKTNGSLHYPNSKNYFAHARGDEVTEDGKKVWREQEIQSDLLQKKGLENLQHPTGSQADYESDRVVENLMSPEDRARYDKLVKNYNALRYTPENANKVREEFSAIFDKYLALARKQSGKEKIIEQLQPFTSDRFGERIMRERIKQKAQQGYSSYRIPTGETIGKIEGFDFRNDPMGQGWFVNRNAGRTNEQLGIPQGNISPLDLQKLGVNDLKVGMDVNRGGVSEHWIVTDILGDGRFKAVPKSFFENQQQLTIQEKTFLNKKFGQIPESVKETFDLTGKSNPQYRRYQDWGKFLKNKFGGKEVTDPQGNTWVDAPLKPEYKKMPVEAFGTVPLLFSRTRDEKQTQHNDSLFIRK